MMITIIAMIFITVAPESRPNQRPAQSTWCGCRRGLADPGSWPSNTRPKSINVPGRNYINCQDYKFMITSLCQDQFFLILINCQEQVPQDLQDYMTCFSIIDLAP